MKINIGLCGFGTVGRGVYELLSSNKELIKSRTNIDIYIKKILVKNIKKHKNNDISLDIFTDNFEDIASDDNIDIVVELIGGTDTASKIILQSLQKNKPVVTANKALLALKANEIIKEAEKHKTGLFFEASVAGGIPVIKIFKDSLACNNLKEIYGILNGTCNYILTEMTDKKLSFKNALKKAQEKGYAESDPTLDIEGIDAAHKLAILINLAYDIKFNFEDIYTEGISQITDEDIRFANEFGYTIKLLAIAKKEDNKIEGRVHPVLIKEEAILSNIKGVFNAIYVKGDFLGPSLFYGKGAGSYPTASSVVSDIIEASLHLKNRCKFKRPVYSKRYSSMKKTNLKAIKLLKTKYYLRFSVTDKPGVLSKISGILGKHNISIEAVIQKGRATSNKDCPVAIVMITHESIEKNIIKAINVIDNLDIIKDKTFFIRIEEMYG